MLATAVVLSAGAMADDREIQGANPGSGPMSQQTLIELRIWTGAFWEWHDTGVCPAWAVDFQFTHPEEIPENFAFFADAYEVFCKVYQHRLQPDPRLPEYYTMDDLLRDDREIFTAFRQYTTTGELKTAVDQDAEATGNHLVLAVTGLAGTWADDVYVQASFVGVVENELRSDTRVVAVASAGYMGDMATIPPGTPLPEPTQPSIPACLRHFVDLSRLGSECVAKCLYTKDIDPHWFMYHRNEPGRPGFDCDDFADALLAWLLHHLRGIYPGVEGYQLIHWFTDCNGTMVGHVAVYIKIGAYFYLIEPQTGKITGPFPITDHPDPRTLHTPCGALGEGVHYDPARPVRWRLAPPNKRPEAEPAPWFTNPSMRQKLIDCINQCYPGTNPNPDDYTWDADDPGTPCTNDCGCDPTLWTTN